MPKNCVSNLLVVALIGHEGDFQILRDHLGEHLDQQEDFVLLWPFVPRRCVMVSQVSFELVDRSWQVAQGLARLALQHSKGAIQVCSSSSRAVARLELTPRFKPVAGEPLDVAQRLVRCIGD